MKLHMPAWRTAWYEDGLGERFAQEMARLDKTVVRNLDTTSQWVEELLIELGQLTQNMIQLEGEVSRPNQVRLAFERALKLTGLAAHLMVVLDRALDHAPAQARFTAEAGHAWDGQMPSAPETPRLNPRPAAPAAPPTAAAPAAPTPTALRVSPQAQVGLMRQSAQPATAESDPTAARRGTPALLTPLMDVSEPLLPDSPSPMREMILALSRRGLSRSEIEVITEQPRHIIEAVLSAGGR